MQKSVEQKYRKLDDIDHCLERPGMWVGSTKPRSEEIYIFDHEKIKMHFFNFTIEIKSFFDYTFI